MIEAKLLERQSDVRLPKPILGADDSLIFSAESRAHWLMHSVEAVTAVMCSAAPFEFKIRAACAALVDHSMASGAWLTIPLGDKTSVLASESEDEELKPIVTNLGLNEMLLRRLNQAGKDAERTFEPTIIRSFDALGLFRDFVAAPLVISGRVIGMLTCLFQLDMRRSDQDLQAVEVVARIFAMTLQSGLPRVALSQEKASQGVDAFMVLSRSGEDEAIHPAGRQAARMEAIVRCLPGSVVIFNTSGIATESVCGSSAMALLPLLKDDNQGLIFNFSTEQALSAQKSAVRKALCGEESTCQFQVGDWNGANDAHRVIEQTFSSVRNGANEVVEVIAYVHDVTEKVTMGETLRQLREYDGVTDCMTIGALRDQGARDMADQGRQEIPLVFYTIEIEKSGAGIHLLGQSSFKELLQTVVARIRRQLPRVHTIARRGDHSFVAIAQLEGAGQTPQDISQKIIDVLSEPIVTGHHEYFISTNVGHSVYPQDGGTIDEMLYNSDIAAISAAREKGNLSRAFTPQMAHEASERVNIETALHRAVDNEEFKLAYQPKVDLATGKVSGVEALIRWPGRNNMSPAQFIPIAEDCGLISFVGEWSLREACKTVANWAKQGRRIPVSVNVSARQFQDSDFNEIIEEILLDTQCDPDLLEIEVTEGVMIRDPQAAMSSFKELKKLGIMLSIDDFGTGYSSLAYLKELPVDKLKIDRAFVMGLPHDKDSEAIVKAILAMAKAMNLRTVAEGVEDLECLKRLRQLGCDEIQGYYFSKALFEDDFMAWYDAYESVRTVGQIHQSPGPISTGVNRP